MLRSEHDEVRPVRRRPDAGTYLTVALEDDQMRQTQPDFSSPVLYRLVAVGWRTVKRMLGLLSPRIFPSVTTL